MTRERIVRALYSVGSRRECRLCGWTGARFGPAGLGVKRRDDARCWRCGSVERHRLAHALLHDRLLRSRFTLHLAPERAVTPWLRDISQQYISGDLEPGLAMEVMDLTRLQFPDETFSLVYCSHVLEHIPDDGAALREIRRVLTPGGSAVVQVPILGGITDEDLSITDPEVRMRRFHQADHVRLYGLDVVGRIADAGLAVEVLDDTLLPADRVQRERLAYRSTRQVFVARRA